jgi:hypothetical protein
MPGGAGRPMQRYMRREEAAGYAVLKMRILYNIDPIIYNYNIIDLPPYLI